MLGTRTLMECFPRRRRARGGIAALTQAVAVATLTLAVGTGGLAAPELGAPASEDLPDDAILVQVIEDLGAERSWELPRPPTVTEEFLEPAFGLVAIPRKYESGGNIVERAGPFLLRATGRVRVAPGTYHLLLRSFNAARVIVDGVELTSTRFLLKNGAGHEEVPATATALHTDLRPLPPGHVEKLLRVELSGGEHIVRVEARVGGKSLRPEVGELCLALSRVDSTSGKAGPFHLVAPDAVFPLSAPVPLSDRDWQAYASAARTRQADRDRTRRLAARSQEDAYWERRHRLAREYVATLSPRLPPALPDADNPIDRFVGKRLADASLRPTEPIDDWEFLRRATLDVRGVFPSLEEISAFRNDSTRERRSRCIDRLLASPDWAHHWVSYWQDVLAENPGLVKPKLNNTGPFRWWIHEAFEDNLSIDRFATELILMRGSRYYGGPAGFSMATQNDAPMAAKAHIVGTAFLGVEMKCARCHDAPHHSYKQQDLFRVAAMLRRAPQEVPATSSVPGTDDDLRRLVIEVTLKPGTEVAPAWPFESLAPGNTALSLVRDPADTREHLAAIITAPQSERFAQVIANRVWKRYLGYGLVEPVEDWENATPSHPDLLAYLGHELVANNYDLKHLARQILTSQVYQRAAVGHEREVPPPEARLFAGPARRRLSAEQLVDSLFQMSGISFGCESLNLDVDGRRPIKDFLNLGLPERAWEFVSLSNERDRPALSLPAAQSIADVLKAFGWRETRQNPVTVREDVPTVLQPLTIAGGVVTRRVATLSDGSLFTQAALVKRPLAELVGETFLRLLTRPPTADERSTVTTLLENGYDQRHTEGIAAVPARKRARHGVSWSNHLNAEATRIKIALERAVQDGDPPTASLVLDWRERMEDVIWALVNTPEFVFIP